MGSCIICGSSVDGRICSHHEEDALFEFRGDHPNQLTPGRFYRGTVDGFAEFGVFVDIGDRVTGLLHRSELDRRLDSLDWDPGDVVYVKVQSIRDNGNVDLGWSIRQDEREFRGTLVDDPSFDHAKVKSELEESDGSGADSDAEGEAGNAHSGSDASPGDAAARDEAADDAGFEAEATDATSDAGSDVASDVASDAGSDDKVSQRSPDAGEVATATTDGPDGRNSVPGEGGETAAASAGGAVVAEESREPTEVTVDELPDHVGEFVRLDGVVAGVRQTSGPTIFELRDEAGTVECAAFVEAGIRAYPDVEDDDVVRLDGEVEERRGEIQVETEALVVLDAEDREAVERRMADALDARARPDSVDPLAEDDVVAALEDEVEEVATAIRKAVLTDRPVIVRHAATADGYVAGAAIERATLPLVEDANTGGDAVYHYFDRRPLEGGVYDMEDATKDVTGMLENRERHGEKLPLFVFVGAGGTRESADGFELLSIYGAPRVVVDEIAADEAVLEAVETILSPALVDGESADGATTATSLASNVAAAVNADVREDLVHLPAVSFWEGAPEAYVDAAAEAGYQEEAVRDLRHAVALEAFYQSYEDKRELIADLLFGDDEDDVTQLAGNVAEQFRTKIDREVETARANLAREEVGDSEVAVLDTDAFTHRFDFPPASLLVDHLWRDLDVDALLGVNTDTLYLREEAGLDVHEVADAIDDLAPEAGVGVRSPRERRLRFLAGEREAVQDAALAVLGERL